MKILLISLFVLLSLSGFTHASDLSLLSNKDLDQRYQFIKKRLDEQHNNAFWWQHGWEGIYVGSSVLQAAKWSSADNHDDKVKFRVGAIKSLVAFASLHAKPLSATRIYTAAPCNMCNRDSRVYKINRLEHAEQTLKSRALRASNIHNFKRHGIGVIFNVLAGLYTSKHGDKDDAITSTLSGIISTEINIFTQPLSAKQDWNDYQQIGQAKVTQTWNWKLTPTGQGLALNVQF
jgi:hypothetical protein